MANRKKPDNKKSTALLQIRCSPEFKAAVEAWAEEQDKPVSEAIRDALTILFKTK